eukprot:10409728-Alexandrium_andersonii.AAC.1
MQSPAVTTTATGTPAMTPAAVMAKPPLLGSFVRGPSWPSSGTAGLCMCSERAWRACGGAEVH